MNKCRGTWFLIDFPESSIYHLTGYTADPVMVTEYMEQMESILQRCEVTPYPDMTIEEFYRMTKLDEAYELHLRPFLDGRGGIITSEHFLSEVSYYMPADRVEKLLLDIIGKLMELFMVLYGSVREVNDQSEIVDRIIRCVVSGLSTIDGCPSQIDELRLIAYLWNWGEYSEEDVLLCDYD